MTTTIIRTPVEAGRLNTNRTSDQGNVPSVTGTETNMNILRGIGSIVAGMVFIIATHTGTDFVLESLGIFTPPSQGLHTTWMVVTAIIYRSVYTVAGGYITAVLAPNPRMRWVVILGLIGTVLGTLGAIVTIPMKLAPVWYPIALAVLALPCVWLGGKLKAG